MVRMYVVSVYARKRKDTYTKNLNVHILWSANRERQRKTESSARVVARA